MNGNLLTSCVKGDPNGGLPPRMAVIKAFQAITN